MDGWERRMAEGGEERESVTINVIGAYIIFVNFWILMVVRVEYTFI